MEGSSPLTMRRRGRPLPTQLTQARRTTARVPWGLRLLFVGFVLYATFGKGFAYAGWPPVFVGELLLIVLVVAALQTELVVPTHLAALVTLVITVVAAIQVVLEGLFGAAPLVETLRGVAPIFYAAFAFVTYALLRWHEGRVGTNQVVDRIEQAAARCAPWITVSLLALSVLLLRYPPGVRPTGIPTWPGSGVPVLYTKATDVTVALTLLLPVLSTARAPGATVRGRRLVVAVWFVTGLVVSFRSRAAFLALVMGAFVARPGVTRIMKAVGVATAVFALLYVSGATLTLGDRELSARGAVAATASVLGRPSDDQLSANYVATQNWRTDWWADIWADVTDEHMVVHGLGWGENLALRYGVVPASRADDPRVLRLPHNIFLSLAGRGGLVIAAGFLLVPALTLVRSFRSSSWVTRSPLVEAARGGVVAALVVGLTDVYLESPQGGILFWCLIGFLWWSFAPHDPPTHLRAGEPGGTVPRERRPGG